MDFLSCEDLSFLYMKNKVDGSVGELELRNNAHGCLLCFSEDFKVKFC